MSAEFTVTNRQALGDAVDPLMKQVANELRAAVSAGTPRLTGRLASGWVVEGKNGEYTLTNAVPYARFVEYGTRKMRASAMMGRGAAQIRGRYGA